MRKPGLNDRRSRLQSVLHVSPDRFGSLCILLCRYARLQRASRKRAAALLAYMYTIVSSHEYHEGTMSHNWLIA